MEGNGGAWYSDNSRPDMDGLVRIDIRWERMSYRLAQDILDYRDQTAKPAAVDGGQKKGKAMKHWTELETVETTSEGNGSPRGLKMAYTAETMAELREAKEQAEADGCTVEVIQLHRRDGLALWHRHGTLRDLEDDAWMGWGARDWTVDIEQGADLLELAFEIVCDMGYEVQDVADLLAKARAVQDLADELPDPDELEEGEVVRVWLNGAEILYTVRTGQNGYCYDTHQWRTALLITEPEEEETGDDE